ncbi:hypothetical protein OUZ56_029874 [Daphnia magna]|uniref:Uncharacterized protein n=1 Tax=Daphnia magna TaxID=35525 RepID=A0ABR0B849_9CRUS|nr:hypothetical protein OUZ56_029874 [Daphnia magna]
MVSQCIHIEYKSKNSWYRSVLTLNTNCSKNQWYHIVVTLSTKVKTHEQKLMKYKLMKYKLMVSQSSHIEYKSINLWYHIVVTWNTNEEHSPVNMASVVPCQLLSSFCHPTSPTLSRSQRHLKNLELKKKLRCLTCLHCAQENDCNSSLTVSTHINISTSTHRETPRNAENLPPPVPKRVSFTPQLSTTTRQNTTNTINYNPRPQARTNSSNPEDDLVAVFRTLTRNNWSTDEAANFVATLVGNNTTRASNPPQYTSTPNPTLWQNPMSSAIAPPWQNYRTTASTIAPQPSYMTSNTHQPQPHYGHHQSTISELDIQATRLRTQISVFSTPGNNADFNSC